MTYVAKYNDSVGRILPPKKSHTQIKKVVEEMDRTPRSTEECKRLLVDEWVESCEDLLRKAVDRPYLSDATMWDAFILLYLSRIPEGEEIVRRLNKKERKK